MVKSLDIHLRVLFLLLALLFSGASHSQEHSSGNEPDKNFEQLRAFIHKSMAENAVPGVAMGVLQNAL